ncbi:hypothetical protein C8P63_102135 [Melghirimyces profundicolus]|uniref:Uncharacterized protein n=1 Tax=Melghirimyces profundicolus TaxID=1242148 RepID=A0A2T6C8J5_9BACL|nr:hypothetical protein [Melghirimyces profundicolus]PTX64641.1 hypothetical protein C8P63_102135 [Melghirimyces profundicolus]
MADRELVRQIVEEVVERLMKQGPTRKRAVAVCWSEAMTDSGQIRLEELEKRWDLVLFTPERSLADPNRYEAVHSWEADEALWDRELTQAERMIFLGVDQDTLVKGARQIADTFPTRLLARSLLKEKEVCLVPEKHLLWTTREKPGNRINPYCRKILECVHELRSYGATVVTTPEEIRGSFAVGDPRFLDVLLLDAEKVQSLPEGSTVVVSSSTLVTPLAKDFVRERKINVQVIDLEM